METGAAGVRAEGARTNAPRNMQWWWIFAAGAVVAVLTHLLVYPITFLYSLLVFLGWETLGAYSEQFGHLVGSWVMPGLHMILSALAASWVARKTGDAAVRNGTLTGLVTALANQLAVLIFFSPILPAELVKYIFFGLTGGLLGGLDGRKILVGQEALYETSRDIGGANSPHDIAAAIGKHLAGPDVLGVGLWQGSAAPGGNPSEKLEFIGSWTVSGSHNTPFGALLDPVRSAIAKPDKHSPLVVQTVDLSAHERTACEKAGIHSALLIPLVAPGERRIGLLAVTSQGHGFSRGTIRSYLTTSVQVALALDNLRLVEEAKEAAILRERQRMAHEIHDTLAQGFTSIVMSAEAAQAALRREDAGMVRDHHTRIESTARESLKSARRLVWALRPEQLEGTSLPEVLRTLTGRWAEENGIEAIFELTGTLRPLSDEKEATILRSAQEALHNASKHARARRVALTLSYMCDRLTLDVRDDGVGFAPKTVRRDSRDNGRHPAGFGLKAMRERAEKAGGSLTIESAPGEGTAIVVDLPLAKTSPSEGAGQTAEGAY